MQKRIAIWTNNISDPYCHPSSGGGGGGGLEMNRRMKFN